jgi:hypothetical protein
MFKSVSARLDMAHRLLHPTMCRPLRRLATGGSSTTGIVHPASAMDDKIVVTPSRAPRDEPVETLRSRLLFQSRYPLPQGFTSLRDCTLSF